MTELTNGQENGFSMTELTNGQENGFSMIQLTNGQENGFSMTASPTINSMLYLPDKCPNSLAFPPMSCQIQ
jgi:hypothetical protein